MEGEYTCLLPLTSATDAEPNWSEHELPLIPGQWQQQAGEEGNGMGGGEGRREIITFFGT